MIRKIKRIDEYVVKPILLGKGAFSEVYEGEDERGKKVAVKVISRKIEQEILKKLESEIVLLKKTVHKNIVKMIDVKKSKKFIYIIMEKCELNLSEMVEKMKKKGEINEEYIQKIMLQITKGIVYLHQKNIIHRDIKSTNILVENETNFIEQGILKIADFGFATELVDHNDLHKSICGTPLYMAPEILSKISYGKQVDFWSLGVILYHLYYNKFPYNAPNFPSLISKLKTSSPSYLSSVKIHPLALDFLLKLLDKDPLLRPNFSTILSHPYFSLSFSSDDIFSHLGPLSSDSSDSDYTSLSSHSSDSHPDHYDQSLSSHSSDSHPDHYDHSLSSHLDCYPLSLSSLPNSSHSSKTNDNIIYSSHTSKINDNIVNSSPLHISNKYSSTPIDIHKNIPKKSNPIAISKNNISSSGSLIFNSLDENYLLTDRSPSHISSSHQSSSHQSSSHQSSSHQSSHINLHDSKVFISPSFSSFSTISSYFSYDSPRSIPPSPHSFSPSSYSPSYVLSHQPSDSQFSIDNLRISQPLCIIGRYVNIIKNYFN